MRRPFPLVCLSGLLCAALLFPSPVPAQQPKAGPWSGVGKSGAVAAGSQEAVDAGLALLKSGGNAADGAAAAILALTVSESRSACFGGEAPVVVYSASRKSVEVLAGIGAAPRLATREHF